MIKLLFCLQNIDRSLFCEEWGIKNENGMYMGRKWNTETKSMRRSKAWSILEHNLHSFYLCVDMGGYFGLL